MLFKSRALLISITFCFFSTLHFKIVISTQIIMIRKFSRFKFERFENYLLYALQTSLRMNKKKQNRMNNYLQNEMRAAKIFETRLIINDFKARLYVISKKLFEKSSALFNDINIKQRNHYFKLLTRRCNYNHQRKIKIEGKAENKQHQFEKQCIMSSNSDNVKSSSNIATMNKVIMHLAFITLFSIEREEKKILIVRSKDLARDECAF